MTLTDVTVTDPHAGLGPITCEPAQRSSLVPGATMECTAGYTTTQADLDAGSITNTGTVTGTPPTGADVTATDTAVVTATQTPNIDIVKSADPDDVRGGGHADQLHLSGHQQRQRDPDRCDRDRSARRAGPDHL